MAEKQYYIQITGPFGLDRRDSAIVKQTPGILYELENFLIHNGNLEVREGITRDYSRLYIAGQPTLSPLVANGGYRILSLFRYYGLTATEEELKEFYAAVDGANNSTLMKWGGTYWSALALPPGITLSKHAGATGKPPSLGNFEQFKDRVYYTNYKEPVLMIKKQDTQVYEAGIPEANAELMIDDCEALTGWTAYGGTDFNNAYLDGGFDRHTEGDYGITMEELSSGATFKLVKTLTTALNLDWFYQVDTGTVTTPDTNGIRLTDSAASFTNSFVGSWVKNTTDGSTAVITEIVSPTAVITTKLTGGSDNQYGTSDAYVIGSYSSEYDYIAIDIFRFNKDDIGALTVQFSSCPPNGSGNFAYGHAIVVYADVGGFDNFDLHQRTMLAQWAINSYSNTLFFGRFRKRWFIPLDSTTTSGSGTTLGDTNANFPTSVVGKTIINLVTGVTGTVVSRTNATTIVTSSMGGWSGGVGYRILDDWSAIKYVKVTMTNDAQSVGKKEARITIDNIRLLKTPPMPSELKLQIATCDAIELWTTGVGVIDGLVIADDYVRATEGVSCKKILNYTWVKYAWTGLRDLSQYGEGTPWTGSDVLVFDIAGQAAGILASIAAKIRFYDNQGRIAEANFNSIEDFNNPQQRHVHMQEFHYLTAGEGDGEDFDWENVDYFAFYNAGVAGYYLYIDNIRIQPPSASKMINKFMPMDLIIFDAIDRGIEALFGENKVVDTIVDILFHAYAKFTRQIVGQGTVVFPEYRHGRYQLSENITLANLQMQVDAGGSLSITFIQNNDLTEYKDFNFNLESFWAPRKQNAANTTDQWFGVDWVEIGATDNDQFSIWMSTPDVTAIAHIIFRFYTNKDATWGQVVGSPYKHTTASGMPSASKILNAVGHTFKNYDNLAGYNTLLGKTIKNETTGKVGRVNWVYSNTRLVSWGITWNNNDLFTIDGYKQGYTPSEENPFFEGHGYGFGFLGALPGSFGKPVPDKDNYYEYVLDVHQMFGKSMAGFSKGIQKATKFPAENEENLEAAREILKDYGVQLVYQEVEGSSEKWWKAIITWKRKDCTAHFNNANNPWQSWQCIAAHEIIVRASSKKDCTVNFQDFMMTKMGAVSGTQLQYKVKLEDELGYLGPASDASYPVTVKGADVALADIYIPYDTRIKRKRLYRTDSTGTFRYLDTISRLDRTYTDQIPEELLGPAIEEDYYRPPKCAHMRVVDNRMAYIDCVDRRGTRRSTRVHLSLPFIPHQCRDADCFDLKSEDGQRVIWVEWYYGYLLVWKERSFYTIEPTTFEKSPRDLSIGCIAPLSVAPIPDGGFAWLSHEGVIFGDHTKIDKDTGEQIWDDIKGYTPAQLSHAIGWYHDRYYYIFLGYDNGIYNTRGYACYLPNRTWTYLSNWNVQCVSIWKGGTDNGEIYTGSNHGYINKLFSGEVDRTDATPEVESAIASALRTLDYDLSSPHSDKYLNWIILHAKNLSSNPARKGLLTFTPYYDQRVTKALDDEQIMHTNYFKYDLCQDPGYEAGTTLVGFRMIGKNRYAIKGMTLDITDQGFRAFQESGQY